MSIEIQRQGLQVFTRRLREPRRFLQVLAGPRQVGKTTLMRQSLASLSASPQGRSIAQHSVSRGQPWLAKQSLAGHPMGDGARTGPAVVMA